MPLSRRRAAVAVPAIALLAGAALAAAGSGETAADHERAAAVLVERMDSSADVKDAFAHLEQALVMRPSWPYAWAAFAAARYRAGVADETFEAALQRAADLGPNEPQVQETVAFYGLAVWDQAQPRTRAAIERSVAAAMRRDAPAMLRIAQRRGRLESACRHVDASARLEANWRRACGLTGATS